MSLNNKQTFGAACLLLTLFSVTAGYAARSSIGIGAAEEVIQPTGGFLGSILLYIQHWQKEFEQLIRTWLASLHDNPANAGKLVGISFLYGILHAAGPGHGKLVISSYLVANAESLKRGIVLSFFSSLLQAVSAIVIVALVIALLRTGIAGLTRTQASEWLTGASYALVMLLGLSLMLRKARKTIAAKRALRAVNGTGNFDALFATSGRQPAEVLKHDTAGFNRSCSACGQSHIFSAEEMQKPLNRRAAVAAVFAVGLRPCTGAVLIMAFAALNQLFLIGAVSVFAMALGTFITVATLAAIAVKARDFAKQLTRPSRLREWLFSTVEWAAALLIFGSGLVFFI